MTLLKYGLYFTLGIVTTVSGISVVEKPIEFIGILLIVLCIDILSKLEI